MNVLVIRFTLAGDITLFEHDDRNRDIIAANRILPAGSRATVNSIETPRNVNSNKKSPGYAKKFRKYRGAVSKVTLFAFKRNWVPGSVLIARRDPDDTRRS